LIGPGIRSDDDDFGRICKAERKAEDSKVRLLRQQGASGVVEVIVVLEMRKGARLFSKRNRSQPRSFLPSLAAIIATAGTSSPR